MNFDETIHMVLPRDCYGEPIHVGDMMISTHERDSAPMTVSAVAPKSFCVRGWSGLLDSWRYEHWHERQW